ncbi:MAG: Rrf2 family transcriptional regulator [Deltaproteobacteria bacterium]|nr:Rrf2 family transcriptional regulator [Deltaproteobacteria bacterium]
MLLSQTAEYALRAMAWLATVPEGQPVRAVDLSGSTGIPTHYLSKVLRRLVLADLLQSKKGQGGGFSLSRPPSEIAFIDILSAIDAYPTEGRCAFGWGQCDASDPCPLHNSWSHLNDRIHDWASGTSLEEIANFKPAGPRSTENLNKT